MNAFALASLPAVVAPRAAAPAARASAAAPRARVAGHALRAAFHAPLSGAAPLPRPAQASTARRGRAGVARVEAAKKSVGDLTEADLKGKVVFVRADLNVPLDKALAITDDTRIRVRAPRAPPAARCSPSSGVASLAQFASYRLAPARHAAGCDPHAAVPGGQGRQGHAHLPPGARRGAGPAHGLSAW
jgi:hypothetical protein